MLSALFRALPLAGAGVGVGTGTGIRASSGTMPVVQGILVGVTAGLRDVLLDLVLLGPGVVYSGVGVGTVGTGVGRGIGSVGGAAGGGPGGWDPELLTIIGLGGFFLPLLELGFVWMLPEPGDGGGPPPPEYCTISIGLLGGIM